MLACGCAWMGGDPYFLEHDCTFLELDCVFLELDCTFLAGLNRALGCVYSDWKNVNGWKMALEPSEIVQVTGVNHSTAAERRRSHDDGID